MAVESGNLTARLLDDVRQLVTQQLPAGARLRLVQASAEVDIRAPGKRVGFNTGGKSGRTLVGVDPYPREVPSKPCLERRVEGAPGRAIIKRALHGTAPSVTPAHSAFRAVDFK